MTMDAAELERRDPPPSDRRALTDRRSGVDRRAPDVMPGAAVPMERRVGTDRRNSDRRLGVERRLALQSSTEQIRAALGLLSRLVETGRVDDDGRRLLDAAMLRLTFALERLAL